MWMGMNATSRIAPVASLAIHDPDAIVAVLSPAASLDKTPIDRRTATIGKVNGMASATSAYAGHIRRRITPATLTTAIHTTSPATTPRILFVIAAVYEGS